jgi:hypothetical protein
VVDFYNPSSQDHTFKARLGCIARSYLRTKKKKERKRREKYMYFNEESFCFYISMRGNLAVVGKGVGIIDLGNPEH